jgi:hypothetical protein
VTNQPTAWNWDSYPAVKKMRLGLLPCTLQPRSQIAMNATVAGALKLYATVPQTNLPAGLVFGEFEPTIFELEAKALEEARIKLDEREKLQREIEIPRMQLKMKRELDEMQRRVALIRLYSTNAEFAKFAMSVGDNKTLIRPESLSEAEKTSFASGIKGDAYVAYNVRKEASLNNEWLYNSSIFTKGLLLEGSRGLIAAFKQFTDPVLRKKVEEYLGLKEFIGQQFLKQKEERPKNLTELYNKAENLERELLQASVCRG